ncbi:L,D-transpeptidase family protein [Actinoplanes sp. CA-030573]|uniref:L,D-transpeptidase family protein n=1 Tax=Actinoplanes sp. CA-030573 TaxID=3239898 RepID=UPI003D9047CA
MTWGSLLAGTTAATTAATMAATMAGTTAATVPVPAPGDARQVIVVTGRSMTSSYATLRAYQRGDDGRWHAAFPAMAARNGYAGWAPAAKRVQDTGTTPIGTFRITETFGLDANPGVRLPYRRVDGNDYWVGDQRDPRTYNLFEPSLSPSRTWRKTQAERLASYPVQYAYAAVIDFNRPSSVSWNAQLHEYVAKNPADTARGSAIFLHVNGKGSTAGCVSVARPDLIRLLRWLDPGAHPRIVMGPGAEIS